MRKHALTSIFLLAVTFPFPCRADEADDLTAKKLAEVVRDPRIPLAARTEAARTLGKMGYRASSAVPDLHHVLNRLKGTEQEPLQEGIIETLGKIGSSARPVVADLHRASGRTADIDRAIRASSDQILGGSDARDIEALLKQLTSYDASLRLRAIKALMLSPVGKLAIPSIERSLTDPDAEVRRTAILALRSFAPSAKPSERVLRAIAVDLTDSDSLQRLIAVRTLGRAGSSAAAFLVEIDNLKNDPDIDVRKAAAEAVTRITTP